MHFFCVHLIFRCISMHFDPVWYVIHTTATIIKATEKTNKRFIVWWTSSVISQPKRQVNTHNVTQSARFICLLVYVAGGDGGGDGGVAVCMREREWEADLCVFERICEPVTPFKSWLFIVYAERTCKHINIAIKYMCISHSISILLVFHAISSQCQRMKFTGCSITVIFLT